MSKDILKEYTVMLLWPDYMAQTFGEDISTFRCLVEHGASVLGEIRAAIDQARRRFASADEESELQDLNDLKVLAVMPGFVNFVTGPELDHRTEATPKWEPVCPKCDCSELRYVETVDVWRKVQGLDMLAEDVLNIESEYRVYDDEMRNARLQCTQCDHEFDVPEDIVELEFV